jgi:hypothetical protein
MKKLILFFSFHLWAFLLAGQSYDTAFGMRFGTDWGLTIKQRVAKLTTVEAIIQSSLQREEVLITLLGEQHFPMVTRRLNIYAGAGLHKGWINESTMEDPPVEYKDPFGLTFIGGIEFSLGRLNLSYDFKPAVNITGGERTFYAQTGVSLRYIIFKRYEILDDKKQNRRRKKGGGINLKFWENW